MSKLFDTTTTALEKSLDYMMERNTVTSANIANAETPNYKAKKVDFEDQLAAALQRGGSQNMAATNALHFPLARPALEGLEADIYDNPDIPVNNDMNTVDVEKEMAVLNENSIRYKAATQLINKKMGAMKYVIGGGR
ncbi:MAG: flagellar basal body rod protein FlgB [Bdellovibrionales bacterium]|nr:flagellar basal body rod protein FlgB [Bdellovibrionales bacterium]